jgi:hypothetical protein
MPTSGNIEVVFTNTLLIHPSASIDKPSIVHNIGYEAQFKSQGYNIIQGIVHGTAPNADPSAAVTHPRLLSSDAYLPLNYDYSSFYSFDEVANHYRVVVGELAYRRLPPNSNIALPNEHFPKQDILGNLIDYTNPTHPGAIQAILGEDIPLVGIPVSLAIGEGARGNISDAEMFSETTLQFNAAVLPNDAPQGVVWSIEPDDGLITVSDSGLVSASATTAIDPVTYTLTCTTVAPDADGNPLTRPVTLTVKPYVHVTALTAPDTVIVTYGYSNSFTAAVLPDDANNPNLLWNFADGDPNNLFTVSQAGHTFTLAPKAIGETRLVLTAVDGEIADTVLVSVQRPNYTDGVFFLNEDWYGHFSSTVNYLYPDGHWDYRAFMAANPDNGLGEAWTLGTTAPFGTVYGDEIYFTRKQPGKWHITRANARTLLKAPGDLRWAEPNATLPASDGRACLILSDTSAYESTSKGILHIDYSNFRITPVSGVLGSHTSLYTGQTGTMRRVADRVFAVHQVDGILVIDLATHSLVTTLAADHHPSTLTRSFDGYLWAGSTLQQATGEVDDPGVAPANLLVRIDPWTLDVTTVPLPADIPGPGATWGAWQFDPIWASTTKNTLYWTLGASWNGNAIYAYDIDHPENSDVVFSLDTFSYLGGDWHFYGTGFGVHPASGEIYACIRKGAISNPVYTVIKFHPDRPQETLQIIEMEDYYWYPSMPIFPDTALPRAVPENPLPETVEIPGNIASLALRVGDGVTDADNLDAEMVITCEPGYDRDLIVPQIWRDSLILNRRKTIIAGKDPESTELTLNFNSNGRIFRHTLTVTVTSDPTIATLPPLTLTPSTVTLQIGVTPSVTLVPTAGYPALLWESSDENIAAVLSAGRVVALAAGSAIIRATHPEDPSRTATVAITVLAPPASDGGSSGGNGGSSGGGNSGGGNSGGGGGGGTPVTRHRVTFMEGEDILYQTTVNHGSLIPAGIIPVLEERPGYTLQWYQSPDISALWQFSTPVTAPLTLLPLWISDTPPDTPTPPTPPDPPTPPTPPTALVTPTAGETPFDAHQVRYYTLTGRPLSDIPTRPGLYIRAFPSSSGLSSQLFLITE